MPAAAIHHEGEGGFKSERFSFHLLSFTHQSPDALLSQAAAAEEEEEEALTCCTYFFIGATILRYNPAAVASRDSTQKRHKKDKKGSDI